MPNVVGATQIKWLPLEGKDVFATSVVLFPHQGRAFVLMCVTPFGQNYKGQSSDEKVPKRVMTPAGIGSGIGREDSTRPFISATVLSRLQQM